MIARRCTFVLAVAVCSAMGPAGCEEEDEVPASLLPADYPAGFTEVRDCRFSVEHSAVNIRILADGPGAAVFADESYPFPTGALVVKEEYRDMECTELEGFTLMQRRDDDDDEATDGWVWQRLDASGRWVGPQDVRACTTCHRMCTLGRDGVCADP
jgi:hypothetical protein